MSDSQDTPYTSDGRSAKIALGFSFGRLAVEGAYSGYGLIMGNTVGSGQVDSRTMQVALKYNLPISDGFELFGRGGLLRTDLNSKDSGMTTEGDGYLLGLGVEYRLPAFGSIFMDYTRDQASFSDSSQATIDQTASMWMLGVNISL